jgi:hypothetical protein
VGTRDPLYLFACHLEWRDKRNVKAYQELVAALEDCNQEIRAVAEALLHRSSPRPQPKIAEQRQNGDRAMTVVRSGGTERN